MQELQCDVSVEEDSRQEWTFTLYDFDNNGKVTREVSARLATSSYSAPPLHPHCCPGRNKVIIFGSKIGSR